MVQLLYWPLDTGAKSVTSLPPLQISTNTSFVPIFPNWDNNIFRFGCGRINKVHWMSERKCQYCIYTACCLWLCCSGFKKRAPRAIKEIRKFAEKMMGTADVRIDTRLNKHMWSQGIRYDVTSCISVAEWLANNIAVLPQFLSFEDNCKWACFKSGCSCLFVNFVNINVMIKSVYDLHPVSQICMWILNCTSVGRNLLVCLLTQYSNKL